MSDPYLVLPQQLHQANFMTNFFENHERQLAQFNKEARAAEAQAEIYKKRLLENEVKLREAEARPKELEAKLKEAEVQLKANVARAQAAELRAEDAFRRFRAEEDERLAGEARLSEAAVENNGLRDELEDERRERGLLQKKYEELEAWERTQAEQTQKIMEDFRQSEEFRDELEEENYDGFINGFRNCLIQAQQMCPEKDLSGLRPRPFASDLAPQPETAPTPVVDLTAEAETVASPILNLVTEKEIVPSREHGDEGSSGATSVVVPGTSQGDARDDLPLNVVLEPRGSIPRD